MWIRIQVYKWILETLYKRLYTLGILLTTHVRSGFYNISNIEDDWDEMRTCRTVIVERVQLLLQRGTSCDVGWTGIFILEISRSGCRSRRHRTSDVKWKGDCIYTTWNVHKKLHKKLWTEIVITDKPTLVVWLREYLHKCDWTWDEERTTFVDKNMIDKRSYGILSSCVLYYLKLLY